MRRVGGGRGGGGEAGVHTVVVVVGGVRVGELLPPLVERAAVEALGATTLAGRRHVEIVHRFAAFEPIVFQIAVVNGAAEVACTVRVSGRQIGRIALHRHVVQATARELLRHVAQATARELRRHVVQPAARLLRLHRRHCQSLIKFVNGSLLADAKLECVRSTSGYALEVVMQSKWLNFARKVKFCMNASASERVND